MSCICEYQTKQGNPVKKTLIWLVGTPAAGKTTLIRNTLEHHTLPDRTMVIVNDGGTPETVDAAILEQFGTVATMANGCFTCQDRGGLEKLIETHLDSFDRFLIEGFGFTSGRESLSTARDLARMFDLSYEIVCVFDAQHLDANLRCYGDILASQLQAATSAVLVTKLDTSLEDAEHVRKIIAQNSRAPVFMIGKDQGLTPEMISRVQKGFRIMPVKHACCDHHHEHEHHHDHDHNHGAISYAIELKVNVTQVQIRDVLDSLKEVGLLRAKGAVQGQRFDWVHGAFEMGWSDERSFLTTYFAHPCETWEAVVAEFRQVATNLLNLDTIALMRRDRGDSLEDRIRFAHELIAKIPAQPLVHRDVILTHPEPLQVAKEFCRQPGLKPHVWNEFLVHACEYWCACAEKLSTDIELQTPVAMRELGISLCWWVSENPVELGSVLCDKILDPSPWNMVIEGFAKLETTHAPPEQPTDVDQGYWQAKEFERAVSVAKTHGSSVESFREVAQHMMQLYLTQRPDYIRAVNEWQRVVNAI
jgi:G3E family GTPase